MMGLLRDWLLGVTAAALLAALAQSLMPPGPVKKAGGLVCGLVLLWAVLSPLAGGLDQLPPLPAQDYLEQVELRARELQEQVQEQQAQQYPGSGNENYGNGNGGYYSSPFEDLFRYFYR